MFDWTKDRREQLERYWREGLSASQIAAQLGGGLTRNAVIGKVHRLFGARAAGMRPGGQTAVKKVEAKIRRNETFSTTTFQRRALVKDIAVTKHKNQKPEPTAGKVGIVDLEWWQCKWPFGDTKSGGVTYCGDPKADGLPYCEHHAVRAYDPEYLRRKAARHRNPSRLGAALATHR